MAGSFTSPSGAPPKSKHGRGHPSKESNRAAAKHADPLRFAVKTIPGFTARKPSSHTKSGFNSKPLRSSGKGF